MDIYLAGSLLEKLFNEVSCGDVGIDGVKVFVPVNRYDALITRIKSFDTSKWHNDSSLKRFLSRRCDSNFLEIFIASNQQVVEKLQVDSPLYLSSDIDVIVRLFNYKLLPESERLRIVNAISELAVDTPDSGFLEDDIKSLMAPDELNNILNKVQSELILNLDKTIIEWRSNYNEKDDPEEYFDNLKEALKNYRNEFEESEITIEKIDISLEEIHKIVEELKSELPEDKDDEKELFNRNIQEDIKNNQRSIFDDVDV
jgi:hypothetical protein